MDGYIQARQLNYQKKCLLNKHYPWYYSSPNFIPMTILFREKNVQMNRGQTFFLLARSTYLLDEVGEVALSVRLATCFKVSWICHVQSRLSESELKKPWSSEWVWMRGFSTRFRVNTQQGHHSNTHGMTDRTRFFLEMLLIMGSESF